MARAKHRVPRSKAARIVALGAFAGILLFILGSAFAAGNPASPFFELDGGITSQGKDDWATLNGGGGSALRFSGVNQDVVNGTQLASSGATNVCGPPGILPAGST